MINIGNFFFKYRNLLFIFLYLLLFLPSPALFSEQYFGATYYWWPLAIGLLVTVTGQLIRGATIGLAYIIRGGKDGKVYAEDLVTTGIFHHCRNPLYVGNILMLLGVGILSNSLLYVVVVMPVFMLIYHAIVLAEENFLRGKFGQSFDTYCSRVNRWIPSLKGLGTTFSSMQFKWKRWLLKEYNTQYIWLSGIVLILLIKYPQLTHNNDRLRNTLLAVILPLLLLWYLFVRYLKKSGKLKE
ncbi:isoprenylcysteine carboxylmethyltransferase family protein [Paraflavitalea soli]|uniref:Isoprenylcysteine carboxylmethyltransferase family protein n=1 Tax=Paraflavitalea soli TaxID=2315862 RepID=A0A3B7MMQ6_9BACT|nr:isoprenylcysteine carboxylmethyltransferase family protein [Paraflavitalea soli]AXY74216.1 isoprenylcysteine carboxylmethyltransferase family protein [Paraflavitalea soli]